MTPLAPSRRQWPIATFRDYEESLTWLEKVGVTFLPLIANGSNGPGYPRRRMSRVPLSPPLAGMIERLNIPLKPATRYQSNMSDGTTRVTIGQ